MSDVLQIRNVGNDFSMENHIQKCVARFSAQSIKASFKPYTHSSHTEHLLLIKQQHTNKKLQDQKCICCVSFYA